MSWYKKAKLIDKEYGTGKPSMPVQCAWCKRWSTHPVNPLAPKEESIWKNPEELDELEKPRGIRRRRKNRSPKSYS